MSAISLALVTGANGFIGSNLCAELRKEGIPVRALVLPGTDCRNITGDGVEIVGADITEPLPDGSFSGVSHVFHLAAIPLDWGAAEVFERVNVNGTRNVIDAAIGAGVEHFVHMSSLAVHPYTGHLAGNEDTPRGWNINAYTQTKNRAEDVVLGRQQDIRVTIIRPGVVPYGPGDRLSLPGILDALDRGIYAHVGGGNTRVSLSYVGNLACGLLCAARRDGSQPEIYVLSDDVVTWREFIDAVADAFGKRRATKSVPFRAAWYAALLMEFLYRALRLRGVPALTRYRVSLFRGDLVFRSEKAMRELGYAPQINLAEGLRLTRDWLRTQGN